MRNREIYDLSMLDYLDDPGVLFLWATCPKLDVAVTAIQTWGLHYRGVAFVWVKTTRAGVPIRAQGVRPSVVKPLVELVLVASTEKTGRPLPIADEGVVQTILAPKGLHSEKPREVFRRINSLYPDLPKLEMFARAEPYDGTWSVHGDEAIDNNTTRV